MFPEIVNTSIVNLLQFSEIDGSNIYFRLKEDCGNEENSY